MVAVQLIFCCRRHLSFIVVVVARKFQVRCVCVCVCVSHITLIDRKTH